MKQSKYFLPLTSPLLGCAGIKSSSAKAKNAKPQDFANARFVEEFDKSAYIDGCTDGRDERFAVRARGS
jgi:hypothetical protein